MGSEKQSGDPERRKWEQSLLPRIGIMLQQVDNWLGRRVLHAHQLSSSQKAVIRTANACAYALGRAGPDLLYRPLFGTARRCCVYFDEAISRFRKFKTAQTCTTVPNTSQKWTLQTRQNGSALRSHLNRYHPRSKKEVCSCCAYFNVYWCPRLADRRLYVFS